jgi:hypothetical protein
MTIDSMTLKSRCSSVVEHFLGKEEVKGSIPSNGSQVSSLPAGRQEFSSTALLNRDQKVKECDATEAK